jgi:hypothetical protein
VSFEPPALHELRFRAEMLSWSTDELPYEQDFRARYWRREGERMVLIWRGTFFAAGESWFETPDTPGQHYTVLTPADGVNCLMRHEPRYDWGEMDDDVVLKYLSGKEITWSSSLARNTETAVVAKAPSTRISCSRMGRRFITFANGSFRSVALDAITDIR